jgi:hypothetical protein
MKGFGGFLATVAIGVILIGSVSDGSINLGGVGDNIIQLAGAWVEASLDVMRSED